MFIKRIDLDSQLIFDKEAKNRCSSKFLLLFLLFMSCFAVTFAQQETDSRLHAVGKQWNFYQASDTTKSKRVLLIGDSVLGGYSKDVSTALKDEVAVDLWVTLKLNEEINPIIVKRNKMAKRVMKKNHVKINDLYGLMVKNLSTARGDMFHWKPEGSKLQSEAVVKALNKNL